jgi:predicted amidohydrolase
VLERAVVGMAQWLPTPGRPEENLGKALDFVDQLAARGCDLVVLPELWPSGFNWETLGEDVRASAESLEGPRVEALAGAARSAGLWLAAGSVPESHPGGVYNTALLFSRTGELRAVHRKAHLYAPLGEDTVLIAGNTLTTCETDDFGVVGLSICFDGDFPEVARTMGASGARVILHPSAYELEAASWWDRLYPAHALENGQWWIMANQCGSNSSGTLLGASQVISPSGDVVAQAGRIGAAGDSAKPELLVTELALSAGIERADRETHVLWSRRRPELYGGGTTTAGGSTFGGNGPGRPVDRVPESMGQG